MNRLINPLITVLLFFSVNAHALTGYLENPVADAIESGISVISGWHCTAQTITMTIDGQDFGNVGSGTNRFDTEPVCGHPRTGFSRLISWSALPEGSHTLSVYADGVLLDTRQFNTVRSGGQPFATGLAATFSLSGFPVVGQSSTIQWREAKQSFVVTEIRDDSELPPGTLTPELLAAGEVNMRDRVWAPPLVRSAQDYSLVLPGIAASLPPGYPEPDFSKVNLFFLEAPGDWDPDSYIRIEKAESSLDGSLHVVSVEFCGISSEVDSLSNHVAYALYSAPVMTGAVRFDLVERQSPCATIK